MVEIKTSSVLLFFNYPQAVDLLAEYAEEAHIKGLPRPKPHKPSYAMLESSGCLHVIVALLDGELIGYVTVLVGLNPHYSEKIAVTESLFVRRHQRKTGAGQMLIRHAERLAEQEGAKGLLICTPTGSALERVMAAKDDTYRETNRVFFRSFNDPADHASYC